MSLLCCICGFHCSRVFGLKGHIGGLDLSPLFVEFDLKGHIGGLDFIPRFVLKACALATALLP